MKTTTNGRELSTSLRFRYFASPGRRGASLTGSVQDDVMIEIFFDKVKDSIGMSVESSTLTECQSKQLASEWGRIVSEITPRERKSKA